MGLDSIQYIFNYMKNTFETIIWDWNGTLLNDVKICLSIVNGLLHDRKLDTLNENKYKEIFSFPVKDYYEKAGFDFSKEDFKIPADEFISNYNQRILKESNLHLGARMILDSFKEKGHQQLIISAMEQKSLLESVKHHQIDHHFIEISGINNHYAASKIDNAKRLFKKLALNTQNCCLIGDTIHDFEVATELGCECILVAAGHQNANRLATTGKIVLNDLTELSKYL